MRILSLIVAAFSVACLVASQWIGDTAPLLLGGVGLVCAFATWRSQDISAFLKIFVAIFSSEVVVFGAASLLGKTSAWPEAFAQYKLPDSLPLSVAVFAILVYAVSHIRVIRAMTRIADGYFRAQEKGLTRIWPLPPFIAFERRAAIGMVVFLVLVNQAQVAINVRLSFFNRDWFNAIQAKDEPVFWSLLLYVFTPWAFIYVASAIIEYVVQSLLIMRWRRWLTGHYVGRWLNGSTHYRMSMSGLNADNPDQRIAEDVNRFLDGGSAGYGIYSYSILLISTVSSLVSFSIILWNLSSSFTVPGTSLVVPGLLFWVALVYATIGTLVTHLIGRSLVPLFFAQQRFEATFRFSLARLREYSEQIALLGGEPIERRSTMGRFGDVFNNFMNIMHRRKILIAFTSLYGQISPIIPYIIIAPYYFAGKVTLGVMSQTAGAFSRVEGGLTFFVNYYTSLAEFRAVLDRLTGFDEAIERAGALGTATNGITRTQTASTQIGINDLSVRLPDAREIISAASLSLSPRDSVLLTGPSGAGKSTLFRAIAGIWPFGEGRVDMPGEARMMLLPQKPYIPIGTLRSAITYPQPGEAFSDEQIREAMTAARLADFIPRLNEEDNWGQRLSGGEQQRVAVARALLAKPDWLFLDESTSALDEMSEAAIYRALTDLLPDTTIVSIGHRSTLLGFHKRRVEMRAQADGTFAPVDANDLTSAK